MNRKKVLIIDDEVDLCILLKSYFVRKNYEVFLSHSLQEGLQMIEDKGPEILFIDNNLPDGIGWKAGFDILKKHPQIYLNLISAYNPQVPELPPNAKFQVYEKPISFSDLDERFKDNPNL